MKMSDRLRLLPVVLIMVWFVLPSFGAESLLNRTDFLSVPHGQGLLLVDPDQWKKEEIARMVSQGGKPLAWLNVSQAEEGRVFSRDLDKKLVLKNTPMQPCPPGLVFFYEGSWKALLKRRIRELGQKGFSGLLLTGLDNGRLISDHPVLATEMRALIGMVAEEFQKISPRGIIILHHPPAFLRNPDLEPSIGGILLERVFHDSRGRRKHLWLMKRDLKDVSGWRKAEKRVIIAEEICAPVSRDQLKKELAEVSADGMIASLPLQIGGMKPYGSH